MAGCRASPDSSEISLPATDVPIGTSIGVPSEVARYRARMTGVGPLLREWRGRRRLSQMDLAIEAGVSTKHLSFVETGRSKPSPELLLTLARHLDVPLRERNSLLLAAGYAPRYRETAIDDPASHHVRASLERLLRMHDPYPGVVLDRSWNIVLTNEAAQRMVAGVPAELMQPSANIFRISLHPDGIAGFTLNFDEWAAYLLRQLRRLVTISGDPGLLALDEEVRGYPNVSELLARRGENDEDGEAQLLIPCRLVVGGVELSLFTTLTTFGTPQDITLDELAVELFFPADDATESILRN
jgi:transcriptional regulator with XRE-family HTH domain